MNNERIVKDLRSVSVETGSLVCLGCGYEHHCGHYVCAIMCVHRSEDGRCLLYTDGTHTSYCIPGYPCDDEEPSVADKIRSMSDRDLAKFICDLMHESDLRLQRAMVELGYPLTLISIPRMSYERQLKNIQRPYREFKEKSGGGNQT